MSDGKNVTPMEPMRRLADAIRDVKNASADRDDVVVELREASRMRLDLLANELAQVFADVPDDVDMFDFAISSGLQPRLWIDAVSHVGLGRDRRTYRFLKDTRIGRVVLAESTDIKPIADQVTRYIAERLIEREHMLEGGVAQSFAPTPEVHEAPAAQQTSYSATWAAMLSGVGLIAAGALVGLIVTLLLLWDRIPADRLGF
ncbi:MAG: hypothetical protein WBA88_12810 [Pseudaminobacter sp.]